ncbi:MAG: WecB/TagA/CpsF family glycosyltransferase [Desulfobacterales bacterium]|nr:WecB/TagA/CpsF family glycosyltransferase [Desulfobacterales bacterium]
MQKETENKVFIGNSYFSTFGFDKTLEWMNCEIDKKQQKFYTSITNIHVMVLVDRDPELARVINNADVSFCDSVSIVKLGKREGKVIPRCYGPDYVLRCCEYGVKQGWRHYFVGGGEGVAEKLAGNLIDKYPGINIAGTFAPPFRDMTDEEIDVMLDDINKAKPDIVWVGLGAGKQDKWIDTYKSRIDATWFSGVGAAFDFISGNTKRAPAFWQKLGLEWFYRFIFEPKRLLVRDIEGLILLLKFRFK